MKNLEFIRRERVLLADILYDHEWILNKFYAQYDMSQRECRAMAVKENKLEALLELLLKKGESACQAFISLLRNDKEVKLTFPMLEELDFSPLDSTSPPPPLGPESPNSTQRAATPQAGPSQGLRAGRPDQTQGSTKKPKSPSSLKGYLQEVSKVIKNEKSQFFRTKIKTGDQAWPVVVFNTELRKEFIKMKKKKSLVLLEGLKKGRYGILFTEFSRFKVLDARRFRSDPQIGVPLVTSDQLLPNKENCGPGKSTPTSTAKEVQSTPSPPCDPQPPLETVTMVIVGVRLQDEFFCPGHHLLDILPPSQYVDCRLCDKKYGKTDLKRLLSGKVLVRESDQVLELTDDHVRSLLKEAMDGGCDTIAELEMALKNVCFLKVTLNHNIVISG